MPTHHDARARIDTLTRDLLAFYSDAWNRITREEQQIRDAWFTWPRPRRLARLEQLQATVEHLMDHADRQAFAFVTGELPQLYHFGAIDSGYAPLAWSKVDIAAVNQLASTTYDNLLTATGYVRQATKTLVRTLTREQIGAKLLTGQTARDASRELADVFATRGIAAVTYANGARVGLEQYAAMLARTQSALAYNQGNYNQFAANDVGFVECFDDPECIMGDNSFMPYGGLVAMMRAQFSGRAYRITARTPSGSHTLTVGPNHPVLTVRGWVRAQFLTESDQLVYDTRLDDPLTLALLDLEQVPLAEDAFTAAAAVGSVTSRPVRRSDLHGDAVLCQGDVDVVTAESRLPIEPDPPVAQHHGESVLVGAGAGRARVARLRDAFAVLLRLPLSANRRVRGPHSIPALLRRSAPMPTSQGLAGADCDAQSVQRLVDGIDLDAELLCDLTGRHAGLVQERHLGVGEPSKAAAGIHARARTEAPLAVPSRLEPFAAPLADGGLSLPHYLSPSPIVSIVSQDVTTVVYDATTTRGVFNASGFVVKNCGLSDHDDEEKPNGQVYELSVMEEFPVSHPQCVRAWGARPDITTADEAASASGTATDAQNADQAALSG